MERIVRVMTSPLIFEVAIVTIQASNEGHVLDREVEIERCYILEDSGPIGRLWDDGQSLHCL